MKSNILLAVALTVSTNLAHAQGNPSGRGSVTGDPAASSANPATAPKTGTTTGSGARANPSGSGTSTSGGSDANGDAGRDKMPDSDRNVRPLQDQHKPDWIR
jgi:hypothetical protein